MALARKVPFVNVCQYYCRLSNRNEILPTQAIEQHTIHVLPEPFVIASFHISQRGPLSDLQLDERRRSLRQSNYPSPKLFCFGPMRIVLGHLYPQKAIGALSLGSNNHRCE